MTHIQDCIAILKAHRAEWGYDKFDDAIRHINRERLQTSTREPRHHFKPPDYKKLYRRQGGICALCRLAMVMPNHFPGGLEIDHINPNREDFNDPSNLQLTHEKCNRQKAAKSIQAQSKSSGKPFTHILRIPVDEDGEPAEEKPMFLRTLMD